jgi:hypothetical protein
MIKSFLEFFGHSSQPYDCLGSITINLRHN